MILAFIGIVLCLSLIIGLSAFLILSAPKLNKYVEIIQLGEMFHDGAKKKMVEGSLSELADKILEACQNLLYESQGRAVASRKGLIRPEFFVSQTIAYLKNANGKEIVVRRSKNDFITEKFILSKQQEDVIANLQEMFSL